jgi:predicted HTH transcriptional regulator
MTHNDCMSQYIQKLILQGEHQQLDFKFKVSDSRKIARTLVSFANTDGGKLLIGVKDNGVVAGIRTDEEYHMIEAAAKMYCKPEIDFAFRHWNIDGKKLLEIDVPRSQAKPCYALSDDNRWLAYVRVGDQNILASTIMIKFWNQKNSHYGAIIQYSEKEKLLLDYLKTNPFITLGKFCQLAGIPKYLAENTLVALMIAGVIEMGQNEKHVWFRLTGNES